MRHWVLKAATQRAIGAMPNPHYWNEKFQLLASRSLELTEERFLDKLARTRRHLENHSGFAGAPERLGRVVEIGTGWFPVAPVAVWLAGAADVRSYDIAAHVTPARLASTLEAFRAAARDGSLRRALPSYDEARMARLEGVATRARPEDLEEAFDGLGIHFRVCDFARNGLESGSVDLLFSTAVLEYLDYPALVDLLSDTARVLADDGLASHWADLADEFAYFDTGISRLNFLRFSGAAWRLVNNPLIPLSRLRIGDYRRAFAAAGLRIVEEEAIRASAEELARVPIAPDFRHHGEEDLRVLDAWISAVPMRRAAG